ncbi:MAG: formamidopyrimidine-DNA glycosylase [Actinomycetia bacterium]|nr:formamidopyrimidine-DNA glycosylase [Actinomycetes bacterium]
MPEILEIEYYRRLAHDAVGREIIRVDAPDDWFLKGGLDPATVVDALEGREFTGDRRIGKLLLLETSPPLAGAVADPGPTLGLRFGMTGRLLVDDRPAIERLEYSSDRNNPVWDRFIVHFADGGDMRLRDPRRLGGVELDPDESKLGIDGFAITPGTLRVALGSSTATLKARILDQARIAGIGNLLADEILWRAGLDPTRPANSLDDTELKRLSRNLRRVLDQLFERGGSHTGDLHLERNRQGVCPRDGTLLRREQVGGRTTYWCPDHQV